MRYDKVRTRAIEYSRIVYELAYVITNGLVLQFSYEDSNDIVFMIEKNLGIYCIRIFT